MKFRNRHGTPVDPVPFLVVSAIAFLVIFSFGPGYWLTLGADLVTALVVSGLGFVAAVGAAYHRLVWTVRPGFRAEIPAGMRVRRLIYGAILFGLVLVLFSLPLFAVGAL